MKVLSLLLLLALFLLYCAPARGNELTFECLSHLLDTVDIVTDESGGTWVYYGGESGRLHLLEKKGGELSEVNEVGVPAAIRALEVADLDGDGTLEVVLVTTDGQLGIYHGQSLEAKWRNQDESFASVSAMTIANVDQDAPLEILLLADGHLVIYDGSTRFKEWESPEETDATDFIVADVDGDEENEIVLSSGIVLSTIFFQIEWEAGESFGRELFLIDIDGDGSPEIAGRQNNGGLRIFSVKEHREIW